MNDLDLDSSASLNGFPINKTDITWMGRKSPLCNRKDDTPIFDSVVYYVFGSVLGHQALVLKFKSGVHEHVIKIHLCQYKDGSHAVGLHVEGLRIENWLPGDLEVKTESFDDRRSVKWLYDRLADAMKSLNNYSYDNRTNNCQVVVDIVILKLFGSKYSKMNSSNTIEGVQLSVSGLWFSFALGSFFFLFGACLIIFFGTISLPILSNYTVPCEANDFSTCQIGVGNCTWPSMEHCTLAVNYTINSLVYQSIVRINPGTIGMRFCFPNVSHLECCGLAQEKNLSKQLYCYLDPSLELAQQLPTYFQYTFEPVFLPLWILLLVFFSTLLLLALFSCVIPVSLHIGYNCFSLDDYNASFWVKTTKRKWVWKLVILFFLLILVSTICILFFGRITGQKLDYIGLGFFYLFCTLGVGVLKLAKTRTEDLGMEYLEDYIKDANQKLLKQEELPSLQGLSFFENVTFLNTYDYGISIILFGWDSYLWFHYRESPCSSYALVIPLYFGILIFSTYFDDFVAFIMTELSDRSTLSFSELFQIAFLCALPALITYLSLFILACFNLYYFISTVFERECSPFVRWTNLGIFLFSLLHLYVKLKILKAFKRENTREKKDLPLAIKKEIEKELHVPKITPPSFDDLFGMVQDVDRFHDEIWILRCCNPFKSKKPEYSYI